MKHVFIILIKLYRSIVSPFLQPHCRFYPTCSEYGIQSLYRHGTIKGLWYLIIRLGKCHPLHDGGYDPVKE